MYQPATYELNRALQNYKLLIFNNFPGPFSGSEFVAPFSQRRGYRVRVGYYRPCRGVCRIQIVIEGAVAQVRFYPFTSIPPFLWTDQNMLRGYNPRFCMTRSDWHTIGATILKVGNKFERKKLITILSLSVLEYIKMNIGLSTLYHVAKITRIFVAVPWTIAMLQAYSQCTT